jgi:hypothetical protein
MHLIYHSYGLFGIFGKQTLLGDAVFETSGMIFQGVKLLGLSKEKGLLYSGENSFILDLQSMVIAWLAIILVLE